MTSRDNQGHNQIVPTQGHGDTWGHPLKGGVPVSPVSRPPSPAVAVRELARKLGRLSPNWRDPERYFEERDEIERALRRLAMRIDVQ